MDTSYTDVTFALTVEWGSNCCRHSESGEKSAIPEAGLETNPAEGDVYDATQHRIRAIKFVR
jgi:hypothetical protein